MKNPINSEQFDSRDLIEYAENLEQEILEEYLSWVENHNDFKEEEDSELEIPDTFEEIEFIDEEAFTTTCQDLLDHYEAIKDFCEDLENSSSDFVHGETIIHESHFKEYCEDLVEELGYLPKDLPPFIQDNIDWQGVADDLSVDYDTVDYEGSTYYIRS